MTFGSNATFVGSTLKMYVSSSLPVAWIGNSKWATCSNPCSGVAAASTVWALVSVPTL